MFQQQAFDSDVDLSSILLTERIVD